MKKTYLVLSAIIILSIAMTSCDRCNGPVPPVIPTPTPFVLFDDFNDGDNRTDTGTLGGYWYTFDDLSASTDNISCGNSQIWPMSANAGARFYGITTATPVPTFVLSSYTVTGETRPSGVLSAYYLRVSGTVDRSGYPYGFAGFGANLLDVAADGVKNTINATAAGYKRLVFWYKNGPAVSGDVAWKVKLPTSVQVGTGPCKMEDGDDQPVRTFTSTGTWKKFDETLASFANETWGTTACGTRAALATCIPGAISYIAGGAQYKCTAAEALTALNAIQWQTNFTGTASGNVFDLEIAEVALLK